MAEQIDNSQETSAKSPHALREEKILSFWKEEKIFDKSLDKTSPKGEFVFYEGPPTANGRPGIHHLEARAFKDAIPRYKTMQGYHVRRKGGWDTHGLPVELQVEKELGLKSKKEIESYGIAAFNEKCKDSVWTYVHEWEDFTNRMGYWVDLKDPYITYKPKYIESVWNIMSEVEKKGLLYKDYKVVPWCPRCGTGLSSHELAQGYQDVKDISLYVKFRIKAEKKTHFLAWTTTPWTLPGNVALAVGKDIEYVEVKIGDEYLVLAKDRLSVLKDVAYEMGEVKKGSEFVGLSYEPLYPFLKDGAHGKEKDKLVNAFKVYAGDFVTTTDGTGIVHIAPMYGQDDFELGTKNDLPKHHLVNDDGTFKKGTDFLAGRFVKEKDASGKPTLDVDIINDLTKRGNFFAKENVQHTYPHCWRCKTPLLYFARDSWYIRMSSLRDKLIAGNKDINWEPSYIKEGRFGEWLKDIKDWAISRERYWGTPLPIWNCHSCHSRKVIGSIDELKKDLKPKNTYYVIRHGQADNNVKEILSGRADNPHHLTEKGREQVKAGAETLKKMLGSSKIDHVFISPFVRTRETAEIIMQNLGIDQKDSSIENRIAEWNTGVWNNRSIYDFIKEFPHAEQRFTKKPEGGETYSDIKRRMGEVLYECETKFSGKTILFVTHETPATLLIAAAAGMDRANAAAMIEGKKHGDFYKNAEVRKLDFHPVPHNTEYELDLHRPFIDDISFACACGGEMKRVKEVMDVWFDSGAMPFAQDHYPFEGKKKFLGLFGGQKLAYPADFISEAIDQTRGWFYTLHAIGTLMGKGRAYKNVICLGHILDGEGKKMSKSLGNIVNPWTMMDKYGADALRFWMYSVNQPGESKNFEEKTVDEIVKKVFNLVANVTTFYKTYENKEKGAGSRKQEESQNVIDQWIMARLNQLIENVTKNMEAYVFLEPTREIREFIADLSQWYLRRSRDRFKGDDMADKQAALDTTRYVLLTLAKVMAPFTPFFAEYLYQEVGGDKESVHLESWPTAGKINGQLIKDMEIVRVICSKGLEARTMAKINVRQPLATLKTKTNINELVSSFNVFQIGELIKDEVNVKDIVFNPSIEKDVELDTTITPELKEEGALRELIRAIQDLRKEKGLSVSDKASVIVPNDQKAVAEKYADEIKKVTNVTNISFGDKLSL
jgi:isoleucyl-tRNA synthetase